MTRSGLLILLLPLLLVSGCKKGYLEPPEAFSFSGTITECYTNATLANVTVHVMASTSATGGFFNSSYDAGSVTTDSKGHFSMHPVKYDNITTFGISFAKSGYIQGSASITMQSISASGAADFTFNNSLGQTGYLKILLNDTHQYDSTDNIYLQLFPLESCSDYSPIYVTGNTVTDMLANEIGIPGVINNGYALYEVAANDTCYVQYHTVKNNVIGAFYTKGCFCTPGDTTDFVLNY